MSFSKMTIANGFLNKNEFNDEFFFEMKTAFCDKCFTFQLVDQPDPKKMFHENYAFFSRQSKKMQEHFKKYADWVCENPAPHNYAARDVIAADTQTLPPPGPHKG